MRATPTVRETPAGAPVPARRTAADRAALVVAVLPVAVFVALALPDLGILVHDFDEAWFLVNARFILRGEHPYVDFPHHEMPLHLYELAAFGAVFGETLFGFRLLSLASVAATGLLLFLLVRSAAGALPGLVAETVYLFSPLHWRTLPAIPEPPMAAATLLGAVLLFTGRRRWTTAAAAVAFVAAILTKPTCLPMVAAAVLSLAWARDWRRLADFAAAGIVAAVAALAWIVWISDGVFTEILLFQVGRIGTRNVGMWSIDSGFADLRRLAGIDTPFELAVASFTEFFEGSWRRGPLGLFVVALAALPIWIFGCARDRPALRAFALLWPAAFFFVNFVALDFVTPRYFVAFPVFAAFLFAGWVWLAGRWVPAPAVAAAAAAAAVLLAGTVRPGLVQNVDPWYWQRLREIAAEAPGVVSFSAILFVTTDAKPGCELANAALTWGDFGETLLTTERTRHFRFDDERLIRCLRANPATPILIDWAFYFFTRPGEPLRAYLAGEGSGQRLFFSPDAAAQWNQPLLRMSPLR